ncbi:MAG: hypothetical protein A3H70_01285 [Candidatus Komeilibacteria bacterium RIFCSPLOWO2_02_FULL_48_11]|uniref:Uncharacterized protein n=1 Tax=Candidatus Komeilibacteria bacterium RIFCSPLOWO2_02_FULL_48_11 TaxID=1798553 RepID=A0A1G2BQN5_9BACT|nr:MAG: hypothetical protein A3H70_01285 [Candidatus Komeilibacteria bacterium RIFCSPLOWO2_02_FULL_48_11]
MFIYDPEAGVIIEGQRDTVELESSDFVRLPHDVGHVIFRRLLGDKKRSLSGSEFEAKRYELFEQLRAKMGKIQAIAKLFGVDMSDPDARFSDALLAACSRQKHEFGD